jgi:DNA-binding Lrp family transcriptional regulator
MGVDEKDERILAMLKMDCRASTQAIADALHMPRVTVHDRIRRLSEKGVIKRFSVELDRARLGYPLHAYLLANWAGARGLTDRREVAEEISALPFVIGIDIVTGQWDFIIEVVARDMEDLGDAILDQLSAIDGMGHTQTMVSFYDFDGAAAALG